MDARKNNAGPAQIYEDFEPSYDQVQEPQVDTLLLYLPGFTKDQLRVQLTNSGFLKISGQRRLDGDRWLRFLKQFPVSSNCDTNRIGAKFESGVLYITQPKLIIPEEKPADVVTEEKPREEEPDKKREDSGSESEPTEPENASDKGGVDRAPRTEPDHASGAGKAAKMDGYSDKAAAAAETATAQLKRSRKMMNVALVILVVVGVGLYLNNKMRSSSGEAGEL